MSFQSAVFDNLGQVLMPDALAFCLPDLCTIQALNPTSDGAGGYTYGTPTSAYTSIPCAYEPLSGARFDTNGKLLSTNAYRVTIPTHYNNAGTPTRINLDPTIHRIVVATRGNEPAKTFRISAIADDLGVVFEVLCEREN
jgi:hypothetical protein